MAGENRQIDPVLSALIAPMSAKPRHAVVRRHEAMMRELRYLSEREVPDKNLAFIRKRSWTDERLSVLFALNSVYQEVLGPFSASARGGTAGIGTEHPITHGSLRFDSATAYRANSAMNDFSEIVYKMEFRIEWLWHNTCSDLIYYIAQYERENFDRQ